MRILMVNKFLYPRGGVETYMLQLGKQLQKRGHSVEYFGMADSRNIVGNKSNIYTENIDFSNFKKSNTIKVFNLVYSLKNKKLIKKLLYEFNPDIVHLNNINYQLTPSIIKGIDEYRKQKKNKTKVKIVYTAHDFSFICPAHSLVNERTNNRKCTSCIDKGCFTCVNSKCVKDSVAKSLIGAFEYKFNAMLDSYKYIDVIICPSNSTKYFIDKRQELKAKTITIHHFVEAEKYIKAKGEYIFLASSLTESKGMGIVVEAAKRLPEINFVIAGEGEYSSQLSKLKNVRLLGFINRKKVQEYMAGAKAFTVASNWCETFGFVAAESIINGTPVIGSKIGAIPEVVTDGVNGLLFEPGNVNSLVSAIKKMDDAASYKKLIIGCTKTKYTSMDEYIEKLEGVYKA